MASRKNEQMHFTVTPQEKALIEAIAKEQGKKPAEVAKEATLIGIDEVIARWERWKRIIERGAEE